MRIAVLGASGRVGGAIVRTLGNSFSISVIYRDPEEATASLLARAVTDVEVVVNAAGVAHVEPHDRSAFERLKSGNVDLPLSLAEHALIAGASVIHISSSKAVQPESSSYARSKHDGERSLGEFDRRFREVGLTLLVLRPPALLCPPFDAGRLSRLRWLSRVPRPLVPPVRVAVLSEERFVDDVRRAIQRIERHEIPTGLSLQSYATPSHGTLRDVRDAMVADAAIRRRYP